MTADRRRDAIGADLATFERLRPDLLALAYRMMGDVGRAEDMVQEAWLRWHQRDGDAVDSPRAFLVTIVTRLCLNELASARARREESRGDRLPEPVDLDEGGLGRVEDLERVSMAFLVVLQRLTPAERAAVLLHDVFDLAHDEIATLVGRTPAACRKLLERARQNVAAGRRMITASRAEHQRLLQAFVRASTAGDLEALVGVLADDVELVTDGGAAGRAVGRLRNLRAPLTGAARVAAFVVSRARGSTFAMTPRELNGQPALLFTQGERVMGALTLAVSDGRIQRVFFHGDLARLGRVGGGRGRASSAR